MKNIEKTLSFAHAWCKNKKRKRNISRKLLFSIYFLKKSDIIALYEKNSGGNTYVDKKKIIHGR